MRKLIIGLVQLAALIACAPVAAQSQFPGKLPIGCSNGQTAIYNTSTNLWECGTPAGGGDVTASGTLANNAIALGGGTTVVKTTTTGTGVVTALGVNVGSAGAFVVNGGALGTPSSGTLTNAAGLLEAGLTLADNTTNNATTSKHGFLPKGDNNASNCLSGQITWVACGSGGGAPTDATYITQTANGSLSNEQAMGLLGTGIVINTTTTGVQSIFAGTSCTNQFPRSLNASGAATCESVALGADVSGDLPFANLTQIAGLSVLGVTGSSTADVAAITAGSDDQVLRRSGTSVAFGTVATGGIADSAVTVAKMANMATGTVLSNITGGSAAPVANTYSDFLTAAGVPTISGTPTQGQIIYVDSGGAFTLLNAGTSGHFLKTQGAGANPTWAAISASGCATAGSATQVLTDDGAGGCTSNAAMLYASGVLTLGTAGSVVGATAYKNATSGTVTLQPVTGPLGTVTASLPARTGTVALETGSTFTTGTIPLTAIYAWDGGVCQNTTASIGFSTPTSNPGTAVCKTGSNTTYGAAQFTATGQSVQFKVPIRDTVTTTTFNVAGHYVGETTSTGNTVFTLGWARVAAGSTLDPSFTDCTITDAAGTADQLNNFIQSCTFTSLAKDDLLFLKFTYTTAPTTPGNQNLIDFAIIPVFTKTIGG